MGISDKLKLILEHGLKIEYINPNYTMLSMVLMVCAIFSFVQGQLITYLIGLMLLYGSVHSVFESYEPIIIKNGR